MKKLLVIALALLLVFSFAACGVSSGGEATEGSRPSGDASTSGSKPTDGTTPTEGSEVFDLSEILSGEAGTDVIWGKLSRSEKDKIVEAARADGIEVSFGADGSMTVTDGDGNTVIQNPDGTWVFRSNDGSVGQYGGNWPDNEYTRLLPKPDIALLAASTDEDGFSAAFSNATVEQIRSYAEKVKDKGFNVDVDITDETVSGYVIYSFTASNASGYTVDISFAAGVSGLSVSAP
ncbi:MAG: hypothetical protein J5940_05135 [Clostridia bacterium]|nr:hypothetical protein [Clostridia bacterium]